MKIHKYKKWDIWYDRNDKCWWGARFDKNGNQLTDALNGYSKKDVKIAIDIEES